MRESGVGVSAISLRNLVLYRNRKWAAWANMYIHSPEGCREFLTTAGYRIIEVHEVIEKNWIAVTGKKAGQLS
jgi:hypothetical protein